jgi:sugar O-acyltransferase (sialic acid O-acetyltransferase NeuD family)
LRAAGQSIACVFDDDDAKWGTEVLGVRIAGPIAGIKVGQDKFGIIAIGNNSIRREVARTLNLQWVAVAHPAAYIHPSVKLGPGSVVFAGAVVQPETVIGDHVIVNTGATVDHDCIIGDFAHIAPGVHLAGSAQIGEGSLLGIGSSVIPGIRIGSWVTVGAGGIVIRDLPDGVVAIGVPAKCLVQRHREQSVLQNPVVKVRKASH